MRHKLGDAFLDEDTTTNFKRVLKHGCTINEVLRGAPWLAGLIFFDFFSLRWPLRWDLVNRTPVHQHTLEVGCRIFVQKCVTQFVTHVVSSRCLSFVLRLSQQTFGYAHDTRTRPSFVVSSCVPNSVHTYRTTSLLRIYLHITAYVGMYCKVCPPPMFD